MAVTHKPSNTTVKGRKIIKRMMTQAEKEKYGPPLVGREAVVAEMEAINEERVMINWDDLTTV